MGCRFSKLLSKTREETTLDPFEYVNTSYHDLILRHLTAGEILKASEVSPSWNKIIAKSPAAMEKIRLSVVECTEAEEDGIVDVIMKSRREYQNLFLCSQKKKDIINRFAESIVDMIVKDYDMRLAHVSLPNIRALSFEGDAMKDGLLKCTTNLEELSIKSVRYSAYEFIISCLKKNKQLKRLTLGASPCVIFLDDLSTAFEFHLQQLHAKIYFLADPSNFYMFLNSQAPTLQELSIHTRLVDSSTFNIAINSLKNLQSFEIYSGAEIYGTLEYPPHDIPEGLALHPNTSIKSLFVERLRLRNLSSLKYLLEALPNLEKLHVQDSTMNAFICIIENAKKITKFQTMFIQLFIFDDSDLFP